MAAVATQAVLPSNGFTGGNAVLNKDVAAVPSKIPTEANAEVGKSLAEIPRSVPTGANAEVNAELAKAWGDMQNRMYELAKMSQGKKYDENLQPQNVLENLDSIRSARLKKSEKWGKIRQTVSNTLDVIANVGGMVADAASQVSTMIYFGKKACFSFAIGFRTGWAMLQCPQFCHQRVQRLREHFRNAQ
jgi:hypothetical protein